MIEEWQLIRSFEEYEEAASKMKSLIYDALLWAGEPPNQYPCMAYGVSAFDSGWHFVYFYKDDAEKMFHREVDRSCAVCKRENTPEGHDGCLGTLPGTVMNACCGHGEIGEAYVQYWNGDRIGGLVALQVFKTVGVGPQ